MLCSMPEGSTHDQLHGLPFRHLPLTVRKKLAIHLNPTRQIGNDWRTVAEKCGFSTPEIVWLQSQSFTHGCHTTALFQMLDEKEKPILYLDQFYRILCDLRLFPAVDVIDKHLGEIHWAHVTAQQNEKLEHYNPQSNSQNVGQRLCQSESCNGDINITRYDDTTTITIQHPSWRGPNVFVEDERTLRPDRQVHRQTHSLPHNGAGQPVNASLGAPPSSGSQSLGSHSAMYPSADSHSAIYPSAADSDLPSTYSAAGGFPGAVDSVTEAIANLSLVSRESHSNVQIVYTRPGPIANASPSQNPVNVGSVGEVTSPRDQDYRLFPLGPPPAANHQAVNGNSPPLNGQPYFTNESCVSPPVNSQSDAWDASRSTVSLNLTLNDDYPAMTEDSTAVVTSSEGNSSIDRIEILSRDSSVSIPQGQNPVPERTEEQQRNEEQHQPIRIRQQEPRTPPQVQRPVLPPSQSPVKQVVRGPVFLTYDLGANAETKMALASVKSLFENNKFMVFFDQYKLQPGQTWQHTRKAAQRHFEKAKFIIVLITPSYKAAVAGKPSVFHRQEEIHQTNVQFIFDLIRKRLNTISNSQQIIPVLADGATLSAHVPALLCQHCRDDRFYRFPDDAKEMITTLKCADRHRRDPPYQSLPHSCERFYDNYDSRTTYSA